MKITSLLALGLLPVALAACTDDANRSLNTVKAPVVSTALLAYDVSFSGYDGLSYAQAKSLDEYLGSIGLRYGDRVSVDDPQPAGSSARRAAIAGVVAKYGLLLDNSGPVTAGTLAPGTVRVVVSRATASVADCPDWSRPSSPDFEQSTMSNYGCGVVSNLAAMVADPNDLVDGRVYQGADGTTTAKAIRAYRNQKPTSSQTLTSTSQAITKGSTNDSN